MENMMQTNLAKAKHTMSILALNQEIIFQFHVMIGVKK